MKELSPIPIHLLEELERDKRDLRFLFAALLRTPKGDQIESTLRQAWEAARSGEEWLDKIGTESALAQLALELKVHEPALRFMWFLHVRQIGDPKSRDYVLRSEALATAPEYLSAHIESPREGLARTERHLLTEFVSTQFKSLDEVQRLQERAFTVLLNLARCVDFTNEAYVPLVPEKRSKKRGPKGGNLNRYRQRDLTAFAEISAGLQPSDSRVLERYKLPSEELSNREHREFMRTRVNTARSKISRWLETFLECPVPGAMTVPKFLDFGILMRRDVERSKSSAPKQA